MAMCFLFKEFQFKISNRNIHAFVESINVVLDTPAKRTLWFHILPILMDDDQEYCKRKILRIQELDLEKEKISSVSRASIFLSHFGNTVENIQKYHVFFLILMEHRLGRGCIKNGPKIKID